MATTLVSCLHMPRGLSDQEIDSLLAYLKAPGHERQRALVLLGLRCGLRLKLSLSLRIQDLSMGGRVNDRILVRGLRDTKSGGFGVKIPLHHEVREALQAYLDIRKGVIGYLFHGRGSRRRPMGLLNGYLIIKDAFEKAGIRGGPSEISAHTLRRTFGRLVAEKVDHDYIKINYAMRNISIFNTFSYLSFLREAEVDAAILGIKS